MRGWASLWRDPPVPCAHPRVQGARLTHQGGDGSHAPGWQAGSAQLHPTFPVRHRAAPGLWDLVALMLFSLFC